MSTIESTGQVLDQPGAPFTLCEDQALTKAGFLALDQTLTSKGLSITHGGERPDHRIPEELASRGGER